MDKPIVLQSIVKHIPRTLVPEDAEPRALLYGLAHEICGEDGLGWNRRLQGIVASLEGEVHRVEGVAESLNADLVRSLGEVQELKATVAVREAELVALHADLADRWRNFLRAISIGKPPG